jgi:hypothetical protein
MGRGARGGGWKVKKGKWDKKEREKVRKKDFFTQRMSRVEIGESICGGGGG